ncbi:hypothetical protein Sgleb_16000 [Streptomyces glebosus]|jgi:hypothetical protein|uniref:Uncharacterized protein n=1 Tax=Streptomyces glebosus TaxID=249580 RepID=A0A640SQ25_9ACTN|nr:hypothetical protein Sgleb_16000 [Streptomyces glebosus]GHG68738.1 hypothetical protein GCM10010513_39400 [Streptomyces glebosus]
MQHRSNKLCAVCGQPVSHKKLVAIEGGHPAHRSCANESPTVPPPPYSGVETKLVGNKWIPMN